MEKHLPAVRHRISCEALSDEELIALARERDEDAVRALVQRHNRKLFRIARGVVRDDSEAEDIVQETYVRAFTRLGSFRGESAFATWLARIALNEAFARLRRKHATVEFSDAEMAEPFGGGEIIMFPLTPVQTNPEFETGREQVRHFLEHAIDRLPEPFRMVFILRDVEGYSTEETAALLSLRPETAKTRLFRARRLMRAEIAKALSPNLSEVFPFGGRRCSRMADRVVERLRTPEP